MISWYSDSSCTEEPLHVFDPADERVDLRRGRVEVERRAGRRGHLVVQAHRPRAVVTDAHRDALLVENLTDVVRVDPVEHERDRPAALLRRRRADDPKPDDRRE